MCKIVVIGSTNTDMTIQTDVLPQVGDIVAGGRFRICPGGKGANEAIAASRLGGSVSLITKTGNDLFGRQAKQMFSSEGIRTDYIFSDANNPSGVALIMVNNAGEKYISLAQGSITTLSLEEIDKTRSEIMDAKVLLIELETPIETALYAARIASESGVPVIINPSPQQTLPDELFSLASIMIPNRSEASKLTGVDVNDFDSAEEAARKLADKGVETVIITMGHRGALMLRDEETHIIEAFDADVKDTSGAGDVFCAAVCVAISENKDLLSAMKMASAAAALQVSRDGMMDAIPYRYEVERLLTPPMRLTN
ncbi:ribokinase [Barnesiella sp. CU968]|uniref:ribokinase n=1 Tax=Barnesiella sp. CU968 TaxID=2780099 RepID=UPI00195B0301|nr:ribokinase [Barnesiella sp. CU968]